VIVIVIASNKLTVFSQGEIKSPSFGGVEARVVGGGCVG